MPHSQPFEQLRRRVEDAVAAGEPEAALAVVRPIARALAVEQGVGFRDVIGLFPEAVWQEDAVIASAMGASFRAAGSPRGSSALGYLHSADALLDRAGREADSDRVAVWLASAAALRTLGRLDDAGEFIERTRRLDDLGNVLTIPERVELGARSALEMGMIDLHLGNLDAARRHLEFAHGLAPQSLTRAEQIECLGALALVDYVHAGLERATRNIAAAHALAEGSTLWATGFSAPALIAQTLIAVESADLDTAADSEAEMLEAACRTDWEPFAYVASGFLRLARQEFAEGLDSMDRARQGFSAWTRTGLGLSSGELMRAAALIHLDQSDEAWRILRNLPAYEHHLLCPARIVAKLRLMHGDLAGAADALEECERIADDHAPRTLVEVRILRAAIEYERGDYPISDVMFDRGLATMARTGSRAALLLVPPGTLAGLTTRALSRTHGADVVGILEQTAQATEGYDRLIEPLSERELLVLAEVEKGSTVAGIAAALFISPNTVKTHLRRLYRKLGVTTRSDAIRKATSLGLGHSVTRDSPG